MQQTAVLTYLNEAPLLQVRTTAAVTRASAGVADNVLPQSGCVTINFRLLPGDTPDTALQLTHSWLGR
jgi:acetylornithine deacetylase/succinyl-diaminopimelate desuccinylase-like protein